MGGAIYDGATVFFGLLGYTLPIYEGAFHFGGHCGQQSGMWDMIETACIWQRMTGPAMITRHKLDVLD
eukprot:scaffold327109_cov20-Prasinocladus_malaysianus.AAC.1